MKKSMHLAILVALFSTSVFSQTLELDQFFNETLSQVKGPGSTDTTDLDFVANFPTVDDWDATFNAEWDTIQAQIKLNVAAIPTNKPDSEKKIRAEKSSAVSQYKMLAEQTQAILLKKADFVYKTALSSLEQMNLSSFQRDRELKQLSNSYTQACTLIKAKAQEIENRLSPQPVFVEGEKKPGTILYDSKTN